MLFRWDARLLVNNTEELIIYVLRLRIETKKKPQQQKKRQKQTSGEGDTDQILRSQLVYCETKEN